MASGQPAGPNPSAESLAVRRRGRRPAGADTRGVLLAAARDEFVERGYDGATVRVIAARAGVDPAMVKHWFGGKAGLFAAATSIPIDPAALVDQLTAGGPDEIGERIVRQFLGVWDTAGGGRLVALMRSVSSHEESARMLREFITRVLFGPITERLGVDRPQLRAALCGSQVAGLGMVRYVLRLEPLATADHDLLAAAVGPTLQRYLTGPLS